MAIVMAACSGTDNAGAAGSAAPGGDITLVATSTSSATLSPAPATTTTITPTTTGSPRMSTIAPLECPDLFRGDGDEAETPDVVLAAWQTTTGELLWELPLGSRLPEWGVWSDQVVLGFPDGDLVGIDVRTCASWSTGAERSISDMAVLSGGMIVTTGDGIVQGRDAAGFGVWRHDGEDARFAYAGDTGGVVVFADQTGGLVGFDAFTGATVFEWGGVPGLAPAAVDETSVYRSTGSELVARPAGGGDAVWATDLPGLIALYPAVGTLLAQDPTMLHALEPTTGDLRWSVPFDGEIAPPAVLEHGELHLAARHGSIGFDTLWHLDPTDGSTVHRGGAPAGTEWFPEMDDGLVMQIGAEGAVAGVSMLERRLWSLPTGANGIDRFTLAEVGPGGVVLTLTFSAERF